MPRYNGHKNYDYWNVALWLGNDEGLYRTALEHKRRNKTATAAAEAMLSDLHGLGFTKTPDGAVYTVPNLRAAISGLE